MKELEYPFDSGYLLKKKRSIKRQLLSDGSVRIKKKIAVLGGSTTNDIINMLELFLLNYGIEPTFYESEYNRYWQDAVFGNEELLTRPYFRSHVQPQYSEISCDNRQQGADRRSFCRADEIF